MRALSWNCPRAAQWRRAQHNFVYRGRSPLLLDGHAVVRCNRHHTTSRFKDIHTFIHTYIHVPERSRSTTSIIDGLCTYWPLRDVLREPVSHRSQAAYKIYVLLRSTYCRPCRLYKSGIYLCPEVPTYRYYHETGILCPVKKNAIDGGSTGHQETPPTPTEFSVSQVFVAHICDLKPCWTIFFK